MSHDPVQGRDRRRGALTLDLETLPGEVRSAVEAMVAGCEVTLRRESRDVGVLAFRPSVLEGTVVSGPHIVAAESAAPEAFCDGVTVVATATKLSDAARRRLSDELGPDYIVLDLPKAPTTADVVLTHPVSPQLLGSLRASFPNAAVIVTEIDDEEFGVSQPGPVSRLLDAGASAYLLPRPLREVASRVHAYLSGSGAPQVTAAIPATAPAAALPTPPSQQAE
jgi:DNA-binding NarL/FixJ family response regulator